MNIFNKSFLTFIAVSTILFSSEKLTAQNKRDKTISISGAFALYPLAVRWAEEYKKLNPKIRIDISAGGAGKGITDALNNLVDIGMVSRDVNDDELKKGAYTFSVAKDAVVAIVNAKNPAIKDILNKGLKKEDANNIWITGTAKTWSQVIATSVKAPIHVYTRSDACGASEVWAKYFNQKQEDLLGSGVFGDPGLALAVKKDALGIGYNNIGYAYDSKTKKPQVGIQIVPLDLNNNGKIDADENFYGTLNQLIDAIGKGQYPSPPARELYFVTHGKPKSPVVSAFIKWVLTEGQKYVIDAGFINLPKEILDKEKNKL